MEDEHVCCWDEESQCWLTHWLAQWFKHTWAHCSSLLLSYCLILVILYLRRFNPLCVFCLKPDRCNRFEVSVISLFGLQLWLYDMSDIFFCLWLILLCCPGPDFSLFLCLLSEAVLIYIRSLLMRSSIILISNIVDF